MAGATGNTNITTISLLSHIIFQSPRNRVDFISLLSDLLKPIKQKYEFYQHPPPQPSKGASTTGRQDNTQLEEKLTKKWSYDQCKEIITELESHKKSILREAETWLEMFTGMPDDVKKFVKSWNSNVKTIYGLIRFVRNIIHHVHEHPDYVQQCLGSNSQTAIGYIITDIPNLLPVVYVFAQKWFNSDAQLQKFYGQPNFLFDDEFLHIQNVFLQLKKQIKMEHKRGSHIRRYSLANGSKLTFLKPPPNYSLENVRIEIVIGPNHASVIRSDQPTIHNPAPQVFEWDQTVNKLNNSLNPQVFRLILIQTLEVSSETFETDENIVYVTNEVPCNVEKFANESATICTLKPLQWNNLSEDYQTKLEESQVKIQGNIISLEYLSKQDYTILDSISDPLLTQICDGERPEILNAPLCKPPNYCLPFEEKYHDMCDQQNPVVIYGAPGIGKTTFVMESALRLNAAGSVVLSMSISRFVHKIIKGNGVLNLETIVNMIISIFAVKKCTFSERVLYLLLTGQVENVKVELMFDGFDEVPNTDLHKAFTVLKTLTALKSTTNTRVWITGGLTSASRGLEKGLETKSVSLAPLTPSRSELMIVEYWRHTVGTTTPITPTPSTSSQAMVVASTGDCELMNQAKKCLECVDPSLLSTPFLCICIAQIFSRNFQTSETEPETIVLTSSLDLYEHFLSRKCEESWRKLNVGGNVYVREESDFSEGSSEAMKHSRTMMDWAHAKVAFRILFPKEPHRHVDSIAKQIFGNVNINTAEKYGVLIANPVEDDDAEEQVAVAGSSASISYGFIHRSIAEFYLAWLIFKVSTLSRSGAEDESAEVDQEHLDYIAKILVKHILNVYLDPALRQDILVNCEYPLNTREFLELMLARECPRYNPAFMTSLANFLLLDDNNQKDDVTLMINQGSEMSLFPVDSLVFPGTEFLFSIGVSTMYDGCCTLELLMECLNHSSSQEFQTRARHILQVWTNLVATSSHCSDRHDKFCKFLQQHELAKLSNVEAMDNFVDKAITALVPRILPAMFPDENEAEFTTAFQNFSLRRVSAQIGHPMHVGDIIKFCWQYCTVPNYLETGADQTNVGKLILQMNRMLTDNERKMLFGRILPCGVIRSIDLVQQWIKFPPDWVADILVAVQAHYDFKSLDTTGKNMLHLTSEVTEEKTMDGDYYHYIIVFLVNQVGLDVNSKDDAGRTFVHYAMLKRDLSVNTLMLLLEHNFDFWEKDTNGQTVMDIAVEKNRSPRFVSLLEKFSRGETVQSTETSYQNGTDEGTKDLMEQPVPFYHACFRKAKSLLWSTCIWVILQFANLGIFMFCERKKLWWLFLLVSGALIAYSIFKLF